MLLIIYLDYITYFLLFFSTWYVIFFALLRAFYYCSINAFSIKGTMSMKYCTGTLCTSHLTPQVSPLISFFIHSLALDRLALHTLATIFIPSSDGNSSNNFSVCECFLSQSSLEHKQQMFSPTHFFSLLCTLHVACCI